MEALTSKAPAKINWALDITGIREDGYHLVDLLMQTISLSDTLTVLPDETLSLTISGDLPYSDDNLVLQAARLLRRVTGCTKGASIRLDKQIPFGAGLGGGSSDAAHTLLLLDELWELHLGKTKLHAIASRLGADIPFFLYGGLARCTGIGTELSALPAGGTWYLALVQPDVSSQTGLVYRAYDQWDPDTVSHPDLDGTARLLAKKADAKLLPGLSRAMGNVLTPPAESLYPAIAQCLQAVRAAGAECCAMTGSGSAVFSVHASLAEAESCAEKLREGGYTKVFTCQTCP